ncbi:hypothetical protein GCM10023080_079920 [Streptomyces pseudoechinosporeus]
MVEQVGQRCREDGHLVQEAGRRQQPGPRTQGTDPVLDTGGSGAVQDEQHAGEERVAPPPLLQRRRLEGRPAPRDRGHVAVEALVRGQLGGEAFGAHGGPVDLHERPQHRPVVAVGGAAPVVQERVGDDGLKALFGRRD